MNQPSRSARQERMLRFFNEVLYDALPGVYNAMDWLTLGIWWRLVRRALEYIPPGKQVLEVGFGPGRLFIELARQSDQCVGLDLAGGMCRFTHRRLKHAGLPGSITQGSVFTLPYATAAFDVVTSTFAFSGFPDGAAAMKEMARVLKPGGSLVLVDIGLPGDGNKTGTFWARLWERMGDYLYDQPAMLEQMGLVVTTHEEFGPGRHIKAIVGQKPVTG